MRWAISVWVPIASMVTTQPSMARVVAAQHRNHRSHPATKSRLELVRIDQREYPLEGVVRGDTVLEHHELAQPLELLLAPRLDVGEVVRPHSTAHTATASNSARSCRTWRALRGSEIDTNTRISGVTAPAFMGTPKRQKTTQFMPL